jgi:hypothetical protein
MTLSFHLQAEVPYLNEQDPVGDLDDCDLVFKLNPRAPASSPISSPTTLGDRV